MRNTGFVVLGLTAGALALAGCQTTAVEKRGQIVRAPTRCETHTAPIYFAPYKDQLTADGRKLLIEAAAQARGCTIERISVVGLADADGDEKANFELSKKRAAVVSGVLVEAGLPPRELELSAGGEGGAVLPDGRADPLRRRTEVTFHLKPPGS